MSDLLRSIAAAPSAPVFRTDIPECAPGAIAIIPRRSNLPGLSAGSVECVGGAQRNCPGIGRTCLDRSILQRRVYDLGADPRKSLRPAVLATASNKSNA